MNEHLDDHLDDAIDRAARELVEHDPPGRLHAAVMSEIGATSGVTRGPWIRWTVVALPAAAAAVVLVLMLWDQPRQDTSLAPHQHETTIVQTPVSGGPDLPAAAGVPLRARRRRNVVVAPPAESNPAALVPAIEVGRIRLDSVQITTIPLEEVPIRTIHIEEITVGER